MLMTDPIKKALVLSVLFTVGTQAGAPLSTRLAHARGVGSETGQKSSAGEMAALQESETLALKLLIAAMLTEQRMGSTVGLDSMIIKKYQDLGSNSLSFLPATALAAASSYFGKDSTGKATVMFEPLIAMFRNSANAGPTGGTAASKLPGIQVVTEKSSQLSGTTYQKFFAPILMFFKRNGISILVTSSVGSAVYAASMTPVLVDANQELTWQEARSLLGKDKVIRSQINSLVNDLALIFDLTPSEQDKLKLALYDETMRQALENRLSNDPSKYSLDIVGLMAKNQLISDDEAAVVRRIQSTDNTDSLAGKANVLMSISQNIEVSLALAAMLESQLNSGQIKDPKLKAEIERMLSSLNAKIMLIGFNLKQ
jgi:hypothetical protein